MLVLSESAEDGELNGTTSSHIESGLEGTTLSTDIPFVNNVVRLAAFFSHADFI